MTKRNATPARLAIMQPFRKLNLKKPANEVHKYVAVQEHQPAFSNVKYYRSRYKWKFSNSSADTRTETANRNYKRFDCKNKHQKNTLVLAYNKKCKPRVRF